MEWVVESTFMRYGHSAGGITGLTLKQIAFKVWALCCHICCMMASTCFRWRTRCKLSRLSSITKKRRKAGFKPMEKTLMVFERN